MKTVITAFLLCIISLNINSQWVPLNSGTTNRMLNLFFADASTGSALELNGTIHKTTNAGLNWFIQPTGVSGNSFGLYYIDANTGFICGDGGIYRTTDGGGSWASIPSPSSQYRSVYFTDALTGYAAGSFGVIAKTTNSGANWNALTTGSTAFIFCINFADAQNGYAVTIEGSVLKTTNAGSNWQDLSVGVAASLFSLEAIDPLTVYAGGDNGLMLKTTNGGANWTVQNTNITDIIFRLFFVSPTTGTAVGYGNRILRTTNGGTNWIQQSSGLTAVNIEGLHFTSPQTGYVSCTDGSILYTTTGGFPLPSVPVLVSPPNGSINISQTAVLDWDTSTAGRTYRVQLGTDSNYSPALFDSSSISLSNVQIPTGLLGNNTLYFWRVQAENAGGLSPWSSSYRFRTLPPLPNAPNLLLPINGATGVSLTPLFDWDSNSTADSYTLQAALDTSFSSPAVFINGITQSFLNLTSPTLQNNYRYYWRVFATNPAGDGPWSARFNFVTVFGPPSAPTLLAPANSSTGISLTPSLDWVDDISATSYDLQLSLDSTFGTTLFDTTGIPASAHTIRSGLLLNVRKYYWRVRTINNIGTGPWSLPWSFITLLAPPVAPVLVDPPNNAIDISTTPTLNWDTVEFAASYRLQISTNAGFSDTVISSPPLTLSQYNVPGGFLNNNTAYYWRVNGTNAAGTGPYSPVWRFTTVVSPPVAAPVLLAPPNGSVNVVLTPTLDWNDVFGVTGYKVNVSDDPQFNTVLVDTTLGTASQFTIPAGRLGGSTAYYWRIRGFNVGGFGPWSVTWSFTTQIIGITVISTEVPREFKLYDNYPNPFNPVTKIKFDIPSKNGINSVNVKLAIYDITGRQAAILVNKELQPGKYEADWNASAFASGVYIYRLECGEFVDIKKMVLLK